MTASAHRFRHAVNCAVIIGLTAGTILFHAAPARAQNQGSWKQDWNVQCSWTDRLAFKAAVKGIAWYFFDIETAELVEELAEQNCDDRRVGMARLAREEFRASSSWLEGLEFPNPIVLPAPDDRKYLAWLDQFAKMYRVFGPQGEAILLENGFYEHPGHIVISPPAIRAGAGVEAHEQFHGVQNGAAPVAFQNQQHHAFWGKWVWEGTARAEEIVWAIKSGQYMNIRARQWDLPLYFFPGADKRPAYATYPFWIDVGRQLRADDYIGYLPRVFKEIGALSVPGQGQHFAMLRAVDTALEELLKERGIDMGGLAWAYPEFVRAMLDEPDRANELFKQPYSDVASLPNPDNGGPVQEFSDDFDVEAVATNAHRLVVLVPPGRVASLRVAVESQADAQLKNLHLIVDDRRYDRDPDPADPNGRRNVFATVISGGAELKRFYIRVANVGSPADTRPDRYSLKVTLQSNQALAIATGGESVRLGGGVLFSYVNINRDPHEMARSMQTALIDRYADHAGLSESTPGAAESREIIADTVASQLGPPPVPPKPGSARSAVTAGAECLATITVFDDDSRSVAKMIWRGLGPFFGGTHKIQGSFATGVHDSIYATLKTSGQELTMLESPEALATYMQQLQGLSVPGMVDAAMAAGQPDAATMIQGALGGMLGGVAADLPSREGQVPAPNPGQEDFGRVYSEHSTGTLEIEPSFGDKVVGRFNFSAVDTQADKMVNVEGQFIAVPRPLSEDNLWNGCELMLVPKEDNGDIRVSPAVYPPGFESPELEEEKDVCAGFPDIIACVCALSPLVYPELCWPSPEDDPVDCKVGAPVDTVIVDWHEAYNEAGERVLRRWIRREWPVIELPRNGGKGCPPAQVFPEDRLLPEDKADCQVGEPIDTVIVDWHVVTKENGEKVERREILREWPVIEPARNGGKPCPESEIIPEERPIEEECVDCVVGGKTETVVRDWHVVEIGGKKFRQRMVRTDWEILQHPNHCGRPCPEGGTRTERRPKVDTDDDAPPVDPVDPGTGGGGGGPSIPPGGKPKPSESEAKELGPKLILDFLEEGQANIQSAPQPVKGNASIMQVSVSSKKFKLRLNLTDAEVTSCDFNQSIRMGLQMMASGTTIGGAINLDVATGWLDLKMKFDQGIIAVAGGASLTMVNPTTIRGDVAGATLNLNLNQGSFPCKHVMDFSFTLTEVP